MLSSYKYAVGVVFPEMCKQKLMCKIFALPL